VFLSLRNESSSSSFDFRRARIVFQTDREDDAPRVPVTTAAAADASSRPPPSPLYSYARPTNPVAALRNVIRPTPRRAVVVVYDLCARPIIIIIIIITVRRVNYCLGDDAPRRVAFPRAFFLRRLVGSTRRA